MITLLVRFSILPDKLREFEQTVDWLNRSEVELQEAEQGRLYRRWGSEKAEFLYMEVLAEGEDVQAHLDSERFRTLLGAVKVLGEIARAGVMTTREIRPIT